MLAVFAAAPRKFGSGAPLNGSDFRSRIGVMKTSEMIQGRNEVAASKQQTEVVTGPITTAATNRETEAFFVEPTDLRREAWALAAEALCRLLIWMADGRTLENRGLRACVALYCIRPDLVDGTTLEQVGALAGCSRQAVHKLAISFRRTMGLPS